MIEIRVTALFETKKENRGVTSVTIIKEGGHTKPAEVFLTPEEALWVLKVLQGIMETPL